MSVQEQIMEQVLVEFGSDRTVDLITIDLIESLLDKLTEGQAAEWALEHGYDLDY